MMNTVRNEGMKVKPTMEWSKLLFAFIRGADVAGPISQLGHHWGTT